MSNWIFDMFRDKGVSKEASLTNREQEWERKVEANDWIKDVMAADEGDVARNTQFRLIAQELMENYGLEPGDIDLSPENVPMDEEPHEFVARIAQKYDLQAIASRRTSLEKIAAYEKGETMKETIEKDFERNVKALSDYVLAEMLAEYRLQGKGLPENIIEEKEKAKKRVSSSRGEAENELLKLIGDHSALDWKAVFEKWHKVDGPATTELKEGDLYTGAKPETGKQNWEKKEDFSMPSDKERIEGMEGVGAEEKKGQVGKEASKKLVCPQCGSENVTPAFGHKLNKCDSCHLAFDSEESDVEAKKGDPEQKEIDKMVETDIDHAIEQKHEVECPYCEGVDLEKEAVAPEGWERTIKHVKEHHKDKVDNPWALAWWMKNKGYEPGERMPSHKASEEISSQASREEVLKKVAEIESPWKVIKDESGQDVIARIEPVSNTKESEEKKDDESLQK